MKKAKSGNLEEKIKTKPCRVCGRLYKVMMPVRTSEIIDGVEKKSKVRWYCPSCMRHVVAGLERFEGKEKFW